jgi:DNA (cytosine-5)-methyltransferase 1
VPESGSATDTPAMAESPLRVAGFFAGIGGLDLGLAASGHQMAWLCESDPGAVAVLRERFPAVPQVGDVRVVQKLPHCDMLTAGFPCQDLSQAGRTAGIRGERSGLIQVVFDLLERSKHRPEWLLLENVPFMLQLERGCAMSYLVERIEALGYRWAYRIVDARSLGIPQRRRRVIVLASMQYDPRDVLLVDSGTEPDEVPLESATLCGFYWTEGIRGLGWAVESVPTLKGGSTVGIPSPPAVWNTSTGVVGTPSLRDAERLQGFPSGWTEPAAHVPGLRNSFRWKLVGNAVNVRVSEWLGQRLRKPGRYDDSADFPLGRGEAWPSAAWGGLGQSHTSAATEWVKTRRKQVHLREFLLDDLTPLSARATNGFIGRTEQSSLRFPPRFLDALREHSRRVAAQLPSASCYGKACRGFDRPGQSRSSFASS